MLKQPYVVERHRGRQNSNRMLHRNDCQHCWPSLLTILVPATQAEIQSLKVCKDCLRADSK